LTPLPFQCSGWLIGPLESFKKPSTSLIVKDRLDRPMVLFTEQWEKQYAAKQNPDHQLIDISI
jgi:peptide chain release factor 3